MAWQKRFGRINIQLLPVKAVYFLFLASLGCALPFWTIYCKRLAFPSSAIGIIFLAVPVINLLANPIIGLLVDYYKKFRLAIALLLLLFAISHIIMIFIPPISTDISFKGFSKLHQDDFQEKVKCEIRKNNFRMRIEFPLEYRSRLNFCCELLCYFSPNASKESTIYLDVNNLDNEPYSELLLKINNSIIFINHTDSHNLKRCSTLIPEYSNSSCSWKTIESSDSSQANNSKSKQDLQIFTAFNCCPKLGSEAEEVMLEIPSFNNETNRLFCKRINSSEAEGCNKHIHNASGDTYVYLTYQYWLVMLLIGFANVSYSAVVFLTDAACYEILGKDRHLFGFQRLWTAVGMGVGSLMAGYLNQLNSPESSAADYTFSFSFIAFLNVMCLIPTYMLKVDVKYSSNICRDVGSILLKLDIILNLFMVFSVGGMVGLACIYIFWFLQDLGASQVLLGTAIFFQTFFSDVPCYLISGWLLQRIGYGKCRIVTFFFSGLRFMAFTCIWNPWLILPAMLLQGPSYAVMLAGATAYGKKVAPEGTEATMQSLVALSFKSLGVSCGSLLGGIGFDHIGGRSTFANAAYVSFALVGVNILYHLYHVSKGNKQKIHETTSPFEITKL